MARKFVTIKPSGTRRVKYPGAGWTIQVGKMKGIHYRYGKHPSHKRPRRLPAGKYLDITGVRGYEEFQKKGYKTLAVWLGKAPSSKHIYFVKKK